MDLTVFRTVMLVLLVIAFCGVCIWAWSKKRKRRFQEAANLPFADEEMAARSSKDFGGH